ncbi:MAG TPA: c-type cytochrome [Terriglobia bacterium]|nr:c-type cytochrome [Terriglobia bacterium]
MRCPKLAVALAAVLLARGQDKTLPQAPKAAEEVYKNIQVLKGVPSDRVIPAMMFFAKSLGVQCDHCHVPDQFEKDDKPAKLTARRMLRMVHEINDNNFPDNKIVSCWMCHRGSVKPQSVPQ